MNIRTEIYRYIDYPEIVLNLEKRIADREEELKSYQMTSNLSGMPNGKGGNSSKVENNVTNYLDDELLKRYKKQLADIKYNEKIIEMRLNKLPKQYQDVITKVIFEGKTLEQTADEMERNNFQNVYNLRERALDQLENDYNAMLKLTE